MPVISGGIPAPSCKIGIASISSEVSETKLKNTKKTANFRSWTKFEILFKRPSYHEVPFLPTGEAAFGLKPRVSCVSGSSSTVYYIHTTAESGSGIHYYLVTHEPSQCDVGLV
jgi:hypothetical protein